MPEVPAHVLRRELNDVARKVRTEEALQGGATRVVGDTFGRRDRRRRGHGRDRSLEKRSGL